MRDGIVTNGRTTTLYGNSATGFMASQSAAHCFDQKEAEEKVTRSGGPYREALIHYLDQRGFKMPAELLERLAKKDAEVEIAARKAARERFKETLRSKPLKTAKRQLAASCFFCTQFISPTQTYYQARGKKAHSACCGSE